MFRVTGQRTVVRGTATFTLHDDSCPGCGERGEQLLLGARNATLGSQVVDSTWASVFNDDKKLIAFSDSVQDAAHRAGFFGARTWQNNVRTALAHVLDEIGQPKMAWSAALGAIEQRISNCMPPFNMKREELVSEFIAPNMTWLHDWDKELTKDKGLPTTSRLPDFVRQRLLWQTTTELTYLSQRGRTLERIGKAVLAVPWADVRRLAEQLLPVFYENYGTHNLNGQAIAHWLWGLLTRLRRIGAVMHPELVHYAGDGDTFPWANRRPWLPRIGPSTPRPIFLTVGKDGCYRCVYQYRLGRNMALVSRDTAKAVLTELVGSLGNLQKVPSISEIAINPNFDSVLESRFIESLKRLGGSKDAATGMQQIPPVKLVPDVVNGKSGFVMDAGGQRYKIEPQRDLTPDDGIAVVSRPDFVIWPWSQASTRRPIAVFCDGWAHHKNIMRQDARKRSALVTSGKFWVWSVNRRAS